MNPTDIESKQTVVIYGASSPDLDKVYVDAARRLGHRIAEKGLTLVSGGGRAGLMAAAIEGAAEKGGKTVGVIPQFMVERAWNHPALSEMIVTDGMHQRKATMASMSRAAIALPGGCGTLDELFEIITWRQLGLYQGHVIILNINSYYDPLRTMLERSVEQHFMNPDHSRLWRFTDSIDEAVDLALMPVELHPFSQKLDNSR